MVDGDLETYLKEIGEYTLLSEEKERDLAHKVRAGDKDAREEMIRANLRLVVSIARKYGNRSLPLLDLIAEGNLGLLKAVERYRPETGRRFSTYATWWIKQTIRRALVSKVKNVRVPAYMAETVAKWKRVAGELAQEYSRPPTPEEIATAMKLPREKIEAVRKAMGAAHSSSFARAGGREDDDRPDFEAAVAAGGGRDMRDADELAGDEAEKFVALMGVLPEREAFILTRRYGLSGHTTATLDSIGDSLAPPLTRERVRQLETVALKRLLDALRRPVGQ